MKSNLYLAACAVLAVPLPSVAAENTADPFEKPMSTQEAARVLPLEVTITKGFSSIHNLPGSGHYIGEEAIKTAGSTDVNRIMRQVPGVNVQEEDGFGLRPNIAMRGGRIDRSADITLMEDSVLIAPAPYAAPEAYYFPRTERMTGIEVRKGSSTVKYGPRTTNGAVNLLTRSVPALRNSEVSLSAGSYEGLRGGGFAGNTVSNDDGNWGALAEFHHESSGGFKKPDYQGADTGFNISDYMLKLKYQTPDSAKFHQQVEVKLGYTDEDSNETYLGLTTADFNANPYRRYAASAVDNMDAYHHQVQLSHYIEPVRGVNVTTTVYRNDFNRNWYKLNNVRAGTNQSIATVLEDPVTYAAHMAILRGGNSVANGLTVRANRRDYFGEGVQTAVKYQTELLGFDNQIETGLRYHRDEQDRLQHDDIYQMTGGVMVRTSSGAPGTESNRVGTGDAIAGYILDRMDFGQLAVTPGVRYEYIDLETKNYGTADPNRTGASLQEYGTTITALVPGVGVEYDLTEAWQVIGGIHKGFAPPEPPSNAVNAANAREEESVNYEAGLRFRKGKLNAEAIGFFNDYENLLGADTFSGGGGATGDQFNGGEVQVWGLEAGAGYDLSEFLEQSPVNLPVRVGYTYTEAEFQSSFNSSFSEWGNVTKGDELPYLPPHQLYVSFGVEGKDWQVVTSGKYVDRMRTVAGSGPLLEERSTDGSFTVDVYAEYQLQENLIPFITATNIFDEEYIAARRPAGMRPGAPAMVYGGVKLLF